MKWKYLFLLCFLAIAAPVYAAGTVTVTATSNSILGSSQIISMTVTLIDPNQTGVLRTGATVLTNFASTSTNGTSVSLGPIYGNDVITDGFGNASTSYYMIGVYTVSGGIIASTPVVLQAYQFAGSGTFDLSSTLPFSLGAVSPAGSVLGQNLTFTGTDTATGPWTFGTLTVTTLNVTNLTVSGPGTFTNAGVFTNTQMNEYAQSILNSCSPTTEFNLVQGGAQFATDALTGCLAMPVSATVHQGNAVTGYANSNCNSSSKTVCNAVGGYFQGRAIANGSAVWGINLVAQDTTGNTGDFVTGMESDIIVNGTPNVVIGHEVSIGGTGTPGANSFGISVTNGGSGKQWNFGYNVARGSTTTAGLFLDGLNSTNNTFSTPIQLAGWDSGGTEHVAQIQTDPTGILILTPPVGTAVQIKNSPLQLASTIQSISATATMGLTLKTGSGGGNYSVANTAYNVAGSVLDSTNLCQVVTIPTGWKLSVVASGVLQSATAAVAQTVGIGDLGTTCSTTGSAAALNGTERTFTPPAIATFDVGFSMSAIITGDGAAHAIALMGHTSNGADALVVQNTSAAAAPSMTLTLMPSN